MNQMTTAELAFLASLVTTHPRTVALALRGCPNAQGLVRAMMARA